MGGGDARPHPRTLRELESVREGKRVAGFQHVIPGQATRLLGWRVSEGVVWGPKSRGSYSVYREGQ